MKRLSGYIVIALLLFTSLFSFLSFPVNAPIGEGSIEVDVPVRGTFLHAIDTFPYFGWGDTVYDENLEMTVITRTDYRVERPAIVDLQTGGFNEGDKIIIYFEAGIYYCGTNNPLDPDSTYWGLTLNDDLFWGGLLGIFSKSSTLLDLDEANRVPDAVDSGVEPIETPSTNWQAVLQSISEHLRSKGVNWYTGSMTTDIPNDFLITPHTGFEITIPRNAKFLFLCCIDALYHDNLGEITVTIEKDSDADGLPDDWEKNGIYVDDDDVVDLDLPALGARWDRKDIFVEIDYMGPSGGHDHFPDQNAINDVIEAFDKAPVDSGKGIKLHVDLLSADMVPHQDEIEMWGGFDAIKKANFGTEADRNSRNKDNIIAAKKLVYHYCLFAHMQKGDTSSGKGELPGNDFIVSLGDFTGSTGDREEQAGTFMHELGHNLGLRHGGGDDIHYKPNYLSVMNYLYQFPSLTSTLFSCPLTFSSSKLADLNENNLNERNGVGSAPWPVTVYSAIGPGNSYVPMPASTLGSIDWDNDGDDTEPSVQANINNFPQWDYNTPDNEVLHGFDDWSNLIYRFRGYPDSADGVHKSALEDELTFELAEAIKKDLSVLEPPQPSEPKTTQYSEINVDVSALGTFLRAEPFEGAPTGGSAVEDATIIDLIAEGFNEGDSIAISYSGTIYLAAYWSPNDLGESAEAKDLVLLGLFSTTNVLDSIDKLNRVPGAIDWGTDYETGKTYNKLYDTDIQEDFQIEPHTGFEIQIPTNANYLFLCMSDAFYPDNVGYLRVSMRLSESIAIPLEAILILAIALSAILLLFFLFRRRKKKKGNLEPDS